MPQEILTLDTNAMTWGDMHVEDIDAHLPVKGLISDPDTGMSVTKIVYKAGFTNPTHCHNCSHGIYVLDGIFRTGDKNYGPGCFIWFPEGVTHSHGAGNATDVTFLFITNKPFDINYLHLGAEAPVQM